ncbi:MAG: MBL fold metallo-hydrolase [Clostridia bacterium]|nr:MBL fold metallo-hydrolase [Clostridia bacterium]
MTVSENRIYMLNSVTDTICNSFIITTDDGKLIVIDGGYESETDNFLANLRQIAGTAKPQIDAWFLTHPHSDHVNCFFECMEYHADELDVKCIYYNFPSRGFFEDNDDSAMQTIDDFYRVLPLVADRMRVLCGGDTLQIGNAKFYILYSQDFEIKNCNNSSLVFRMELGGKSVMFTGDSETQAGEKILRLWKDSGLLDCDICQMSHHGQSGLQREFYEAVNPQICLWPTPSWLWTNCDGTGPFKTLFTRSWMEDLGVHEHYIMKDGKQVITL